MLTEEEFQLLHQGTERFILERLRPLEMEMEDNDGLPRETWAALAEISQSLGLYNANMPAEVGGSDLTMVQLARIGELFGQTSWPFTYLFARPNAVMLRGTPEQQGEYLKPVMAGHKTQCFGLTEPAAGSYTSGIKTRARKVDGGWRITGTKHFISNAQIADFAIVIAVTGERPGGRPEATAFFVDRGTEGFSVGARQEGLGFRGMDQSELVLDDCFVGDDKVLGEIGQGLDYGFGFLAERRLFLSAYCVGVMKRLVDTSVGYLAERQVQGGPLLMKQGLRWQLAEMEADHYACQSVLRAAAASCEAILRQDPAQVPPGLMQSAVKEVSVAKLLCTGGANRSADVAVQLHGGFGWTKGSIPERIFRDVRATRIMDGTDEIHKEIIARDLIRSRR